MESSAGYQKSKDLVTKTLKEGVDELQETNKDHKEGEVTKAVENETSKIPSIVYLSLAVTSMALSLGLAMRSKNKDTATFVGLWAPSFLILGLYNKIVKTQGSDMSRKIG